ncbi:MULTISPECIES: N-acetylglucosamine-6-phosphate deacetylase [unclassified Alteromonas]|uniref:N-acetylglucosamine-6-phosphate deacetylase n=1 Tax=unclassified Alteromonas TaxID=2614992 RepID=UPI00050955F5|nr:MULTISPECIES: N-acetylglucosamine-6-phosphate deacetylase [unclassified Alteromonas]
MKKTIYVDSLLVNAEWKTQQVMIVEDGTISDIVDAAKFATGSEMTANSKHLASMVNVDERIEGTVIPGYVDTQVNGGGGVMFNHAPTLESLNIIADAHAQFGTTSLFPTLITDDFATICSAADAISQAIRLNHPSIMGVHFEGPHLSVAKKGVHKAAHIRSISDEELAVYTRKDIGQVIVTVAPENVSPEVVQILVKENVIVALGHSNAPYEVVQQALDAGATGFTHLFNAMSPLTSREPGMVGAALLSDAVCGLIVDHQHLHKKSAELACKVKGEEGIMLVTDAMAHVGGAQDTVAFFDTEITRTGEKLTTPDGTLAGSCLDMHSALRHCVNDLGITLKSASVMASTTASCFTRTQRNIGQLVTGAAANFVVLDEQLHLKQVWQHGNILKRA